jgi:hypothetical protein
MLQHAGHAVDTLYYEVLDMPLPQLEQLKSLRVSCLFSNIVMWLATATGSVKFNLLLAIVRVYRREACG